MSANSKPFAPPAKPPRFRNLLKNLALSAASLLLCIILMEVVLRFMGYGNVEVYQPDPKVFWRLKPNQNCFTKVDHQPVRINSHGTRGAEFDLAKPANAVRILCLGDSRTFGWGLAEEDTYAGRLQTQLQKQVGSRKTIEVINAGVNAWSYPQMLIYFREYALAFDPDFVILGGANYWTQFSDQTDPEFAKQFRTRVWLKNFLRRFAIFHYVVEVQLKEFYQRYRQKFIPVDPENDPLFKDQQQADPNAIFRESIESLCRLAHTNGVRPILLFLPNAEGWEAKNQTMIREVKKKIGQQLAVPFIDLTAHFEPAEKPLYLEADPVHFNVDGNAIIAQRLFEVLSPLVTP